MKPPAGSHGPAGPFGAGSGQRDLVCKPAAVRGQSPEAVIVEATMPPASGFPLDFAPVSFGTVSPFDPRRPLMSYSRMFDGADADLTAALRDYVDLGDDLRSGGWQAYLHRSDDFLRFTARLMIDEMLMLHGGETRHRLVLTGVRRFD
jgi:hypothetical protein